MSIRVIQRVWERSKHRGSALNVLLAIADHAADDGTDAYPTVTRLAQRARVSEREVQRIIQCLETSGELHVERNAGRHRANRYTVLLVGKVKDPAPSPSEKVTAVSPSPPEKVTAVSPSPSEKVTAVSPSPSEKGDSSVTLSTRKGDTAITLQMLERVTLVSPKPSLNLKDLNAATIVAGAPEISPIAKPVRANKFAQVLDAIRALDSTVQITGDRGRNAKAVRDCDADPTVIAEAYVALWTGEWDDPFLRKRGSIHAVVDNLGGYLARKRRVGLNGTRPGPSPPKTLTGPGMLASLDTYQAWSDLDDTEGTDGCETGRRSGST